MMLHSVTAHTFLQLRDILHQLSDEEYNQNLEIISQSSLGAHVRHVLEFYICLAEGLNQDMVNYDSRKRNHRLANDRSYALAELDILYDVFCNQALEETAIQHVICFNETEISSTSSVSRELVYLIEHSIHHFAIINIALRQSFSHISVHKNFGIAYSTCVHTSTQETQPSAAK